MAEAEVTPAEETPQASEPEVETKESEPQETEQPEDEPREEPQQDRGDREVYERKTYRTAKKLEAELQAEREARIRLEEQYKALAAQRTEQPKAQKVFTPQEVQAAIDAGNISQAEGAVYLARIEAEKILTEREQTRKAQEPIYRAVSEINEYRQYLPWLSDRNDPKFRDVRKEYDRLVNQFGYPGDERTELIALEKVAGSLETYKKRKEMANLTRSKGEFHAERSEGGSNSEDTKVDLSKAPPRMKAVWEKTKTPVKARIQELEIYNALKAGKRVV